MKFEVIDSNNRIAMNCTDTRYIPPNAILDSMTKAGYKFKIDGKVVSAKKVKEFYEKEKEVNDEARKKANKRATKTNGKI